MHQTFASSKDKQNYVQDYCEGFYVNCAAAQMLNECYRADKAMACLYNAGVDCFDATQCHCCGWNPMVAAERLRKWRKAHREDR